MAHLKYVSQRLRQLFLELIKQAQHQLPHLEQEIGIFNLNFGCWKVGITSIIR